MLLIAARFKYVTRNEPDLTDVSIKQPIGQFL